MILPLARTEVSRWGRIGIGLEIVTLAWNVVGVVVLSVHLPDDHVDRPDGSAVVGT